ncbi:MotA/TolQ/ExbB proton channel family protein [Chitinimonas sp. BJYL2]|uniref:MotA/TolQ/ExbB proton channel family protein n=1 Tax=Chitinimonas sp. BJYL2 TaxID=2976696 RepID=UPI0022B2BA8D|nr:MotA/TolQ/ExbB proton channel family protein [Chitinimonas sp. BJYL2]
MIDTSQIPAVEITLWSLVGFSVATWLLIFIKGWQFGQLGRQNKRFSKQFWGAANLREAASSVEDQQGSLQRLAALGFKALSEPSHGEDLEHSWDRQERLERYLRQQIQKEYRTLESGLTLLASIGSTAPFVGLFGTVWGIINAMTDIGRLGSATIDVVAGPIGEALIATGIGIAVAVPAVLAYNFFVRRLKLISADLDDFASDFLNLAQRSGFRLPQPAAQADNKVVGLARSPREVTA